MLTAVFALVTNVRADELPSGIVAERPAEGRSVEITDGPHKGRFMVAYTHRFPLYGDRVIEMRFEPIPGGEYLMGSPAGEAERRADEGPQARVRVEPMWMSVYEVTWDQYTPFLEMYSPALSQKMPKIAEDRRADAVSIPTPVFDQEWQPIIFAMGFSGGYPAAGMTELSARMYTKLLSMSGGAFFRIPTESEWEYATRAGTTTAYFFGDDVTKLGEYAWYFENTEWEDPDRGHPDVGAGYRKVGQKKPNPWGLYDVYGNVCEWVIDEHDAKHYAALAGRAQPVAPFEAIRWPTEPYGRVVRGGHWDDDAPACRSAARAKSTVEWSWADAQLPRSIWHHTDYYMGARVIRPLVEPDAGTQTRFWGPLDEHTREAMQEFRQVQVLLEDFRKLDFSRIHRYTERPPENGEKAPEE